MTGMRRFLGNVGRLGVKELWSLRHDPVLLFLVVYAFGFAVYSAAEDAAIDVENAAVAVVDEDGSPLSRRLRDALREPHFREPELVDWSDVDPGMEAGRYTFALVIPARFEADVLAGRVPTLPLDVDATAMSTAGRGTLYVQSIVEREVARHLADEVEESATQPLRLVARARFNPNLESRWFQGVIEVVSNITFLAMILAGAAVIREREHGTLEHLLTMPVRPTEIMLGKVWANGAVILLGALLSLQLVVRGLLGVPFAGSLGFFAAGAILYLFSITALGIFLATTTRSMPQFGLLAIPVFITMILLSGTYTPLEAMPEALQWLMGLSPSTHFTNFAKSVLFRAAPLSAVWQDLAGMAATGGVFFAAALVRFRASVAAAQE
jgi:ABC-2 type transport system permease protein